MRKVQRGQTWRPPTAVEHNATAEATEWYLRNKRLSQPSDPNSNVWPVKLQNISGTDYRQYDTLALTGNFILDEVTHEAIWLEADIISTPARLYGVLIDPAAGSDGIARARISGVCPAYVDVISDAHRRAFLDASSGTLTSSLTGPVQLLSTPEGTGEQLLAVNLSNRAAVKLYGFSKTGGIAAATKTSDTITCGSASVDVWTYDWANSQYVPLKDSGDTQVTVTVYNPWPAAITADRWISFSEDDDGRLTIDAEACTTHASS